VTVKHGGKTYAATYTLEHGMVHVRTHTETRSAELAGNSAEQIARRADRDRQCVACGV